MAGEADILVVVVMLVMLVVVLVVMVAAAGVSSLILEELLFGELVNGWIVCLNDELLCDDVLLNSRLGGGGQSSYTLFKGEDASCKLSRSLAVRNYVPTAEAGIWMPKQQGRNFWPRASHNDTHPDASPSVTHDARRFTVHAPEAVHTNEVRSLRSTKYEYILTAVVGLRCD